MNHSSALIKGITQSTLIYFPTDEDTTIYNMEEAIHHIKPKPMLAFLFQTPPSGIIRNKHLLLVPITEVLL